jgi:hypothetical protein
MSIFEFIITLGWSNPNSLRCPKLAAISFGRSCFIRTRTLYLAVIYRPSWLTENRISDRFSVSLIFKTLKSVSSNLLLTSPLGPARSLIWFPLACNLACLLNIAEVIFLLLLTSISSIDDYFLHKMSFIGFAVCGVTYMFLSTWLFDISGRRKTSQLVCL